MRRLCFSRISEALMIFILGVSIIGQSLAAESIEALLFDMNLCFIHPGDESSPTPLSVPGLGHLLVTKFCCTDTVVRGLYVKPEIISDGKQWRGSTRVSFSLNEFFTKCAATWVYPSRNSRNPSSKAVVPPGTFEVEIGQKSPFLPFIRGSANIKGSLISSGSERFPFPRKTTTVDCKTNFKILKLQIFSHDWVSKLFSSSLVQKFIRMKVCGSMRKDLRKTIDSSLADVRKLMVPMMSRIAPDLSAPVPPNGSGSSVDLLTGSLPKFTHHLLQQGLTTGGLENLFDRITGGTGSIPLVFPQEYKVIEEELEYPANISVNLSVAAGGIRGINSLRALDLSPTGHDSIAFKFSQQKFDMHLELHARVALRDESSSSFGAMQRISDAALEALFERFLVLLQVSDIDINVRAGVVMDKARLTHLLKGQSWFTGSCAPTMVQAANVTAIDVRATVENMAMINLRWGTELESDIIRSIDNLLKYFSDPRLKRSVSRMAQAYLADEARKIVNAQIADILARARSEPSCEPKFGIGHQNASSAFALIAIAAAAVALSLALHRNICRYGEKIGLKQHAGRCAFSLALCGILLVIGGLLGFPFVAGLRLHNGDEEGDAMDSILNIFVMGVKDELAYIPFGVAAIGLSVIAFGIARFLAITMYWLNIEFKGEGRSKNETSSTRFALRSADCVRWFSAMGSWDLALVFFVATQVCGLYTKILEFGDSYADIGVQLNGGFYFTYVGFLFIDLASLYVYRYCCHSSARAAVAISAQQNLILPEPQHPHPEALVGLAVALLGLVVAPVLNLWSHSYKGLIGHVMHYQSSTLDRSTFLLGILWDLGQYLVEPWSGSFGALFLQVVLLLHVVVAPIVHASMALLIGMTLYKDRRRDGPRSSHILTPASSTLEHRAVLAKNNITRNSSSKKWIERDCISYLMLFRMWSGADSFAFFLFVFVSQIGNELAMLTKDMCEPMAPALEAMEKMGHGRDCYAANVSFGLGLYVLLFSGIMARVFAERCAHGPVRAHLAKSREGKDQASSNSSMISM